jgi:hypothetical protein
MNVLMVRAKIKEENVTDAHELVENLKDWYAEPPTVERMTVIGSYQLF